ncbi:MAG: 4'-phosphopantetheinyl transferase superfamily protein [Synergistaceae bacterium]|jgi:4'-phosphopantetheinyl transferase|nr:4'-phosphopantetheinyl transferase superfamily protein [Synergistaceae bacterium]
MKAAVHLMDIRRVAQNIRDVRSKISAAYPKRARRIERLAREEDRLRSLAANLLLYETLGASEILYGARGKPYVTGGPHFSLSHSGDYAMLAVDDEPVGVDIEKWIEDDYLALARVSFHERERAVFERAPSAKTFFDTWTLKESYVKMLGTGLSTELRSFCVKIDGDRACTDSDVKACFRLYRLEGYSVALCSPHSHWPEKLNVLE